MAQNDPLQRVSENKARLDQQDEPCPDYTTDVHVPVPSKQTGPSLRQWRIARATIVVLSILLVVLIGAHVHLARHHVKESQQWQAVARRWSRFSSNWPNGLGLSLPLFSHPSSGASVRWGSSRPSMLSQISIRRSFFPVSSLWLKDRQREALPKDAFVASPAFPFHSLSMKQIEQPLCDAKVKQYSGYLNIEKEEDKKSFFYWAFESRGDPTKDPVILWLNGGPGCSSLTGLFMELGPCRVNKEGSDTFDNPHSWNKAATVIFLDQPVNVGFSYGSSTVHDTFAAAEDVFAFLQLFFQHLPQFAQLPFHVAGESYAGHYIPVIGSRIVEYNRHQFDQQSLLSTFKDKLLPIRLQSLMIGNGLTDPLTQYEFYPEMACHNPYGPVLSEMECNAMKKAVPFCQNRIQSCYDTNSTFSCFVAAQACAATLLAPYTKSGQNVYDVRKKCGSNPLCYGILDSISTYLNRPEVQKAIGVVPTQYVGCNMRINLMFGLSGDWMKAFQGYVAQVLESGIDVLIYAGDADFICNYLGNRAWTLKLPWSGHAAFNAAKEVSWTSTNASQQTYGQVRELPRTKERGGLTFLRVAGAGHMVPYDQPEASLEMVEKWICRKSFST